MFVINGISTFSGYLMRNPPFSVDSTIDVRIKGFVPFSMVFVRK